jgi:DNA end-binding protein Ku
MVKGYEFEKDRYVLFTPDELKAVEESATHTIDIVAFIPEKAVDPIYYDKAYFIAPDKRGGKPYTLLRAAMHKSGRCALAKWAWKGKQYVVQIRAAEDGLVLQQLLYADEVRSMKELQIEEITPSAAEVQLALQLIDQISQDSYDPTQFVDEEKQRILAAIDAKIAGKQVVAVEHHEEAASGGQIIDLTEMLRASLAKSGAGAAKRQARTPAAAEVVTPLVPNERKGVKRAAKTAGVAAPASARARK